MPKLLESLVIWGVIGRIVVCTACAALGLLTSLVLAPNGVVDKNGIVHLLPNLSSVLANPLASDLIFGLTAGLQAVCLLV